MKGRGIAPTVALYVGIISIILSIIVKVFVIPIPMSAISFVHFANAWFLIAIVCYVHDIWIKTGK
ncbi:MAG: hypothetical protein HY769_01930 [Candidatus Stahlbacteria bacterium]|nr:hypothetical protein [Candidatus Stahlbacteria bacterium]